MPDIIKLKRSGVAGAAPSSLELGEPALNYADGVIYYKNSAGAIVAFGGGDTLLRSLFVPPAPTSVTATAGNAQASVSWTAPTVLAQTPITDYVVQYSSNSGSSWTTFSDGTSTTASATVTGLTNGTSYIFRVAAVNGVGQGAYSTASSAVLPAAPAANAFSSAVMRPSGSFSGSGTAASKLIPSQAFGSGNNYQNPTTLTAAMSGTLRITGTTNDGFDWDGRFIRRNGVSFFGSDSEAGKTLNISQTINTGDVITFVNSSNTWPVFNADIRIWIE